MNTQAWWPYWWFAILGVACALSVAAIFYRWMLRQSEGDESIRRIAAAVRSGANAYLRQQTRVVAVYFAIMFLLLGAMAYGFGVQTIYGPFAFLTGGFFSGLAGWIGMQTATRASGRTTHACTIGLNSGLRVAFRSGAVMGLAVVGLALLDLSLWLGALLFLLPHFGVSVTTAQITATLFCSVLGASSQALFARVGGGIFTKAADVGADLVGKVEQNIPEDDSRNPATIADNVGDNVGDVAGMGADLYESYLGSLVASVALGGAAFASDPSRQLPAMLFPLLLAAGGIFVSVCGIFRVRTREDAGQHALLGTLSRAVAISSLGVAITAVPIVWLLLVRPANGEVVIAAMGRFQLPQPYLPMGNAMYGVLGSIVTGLAAGVLIGRWTEYSTSDVYAPTRRIADAARTGPATVIISGIAEGMGSVWVPVVTVGVAILVAFGCCTGFDFADPQRFGLGLYGIAIAAVGMLSTLGLTLATDAYGPIADNAGGNAEMTHQSPSVRARTDALDSLGNTTAATGKGFAIGSAALTAAALLATYVDQVRVSLDRSAVVAEASGELDGNLREIGSGIIARRTTLPGVGRTAEAFLLLDSEAPWRSGLGPLLRQQSVIPVRTATVPQFVRFYRVHLMNPAVLVGLFLGVMLPFLFCAMTMKAVGRAAGQMVTEVRRQFREIPGILEGSAEPDYEACVGISTRSALHEMIAPACLGIFAPILVGLLLGVAGVMGLLAGGLTGGFCLAVMMANAGGAWDNAKKYIEAGAHGGKGTDAHRAAVVGDTVGDPFKDTSGPSLNILIKLMSMVSIVFAGLVVRYGMSL